MKFKDKGTFGYPKFIDETAGYLGKFRTLLNADLHKAASEYSRGDKGEAVDVLGIKAELLAQHFLHSYDVRFTSAKLIDDKPVISPDIIIGDKVRIDVKGVREDGTVLMVNEKAHNKGKEITHYWFIKPLGNLTCKYWIVKHSEISEWDLQFCGYTNAYCMPIDAMTKFDFKNFPQAATA